MFKRLGSEIKKETAVIVSKDFNILSIEINENDFWLLLVWLWLLKFAICLKYNFFNQLLIIVPVNSILFNFLTW